MNFKFVIARYSEDVSWIYDHDYINYNSVIINKGDILTNDTPFKGQQILLSNEPTHGRESDSYLHYIISNYNSLPDYVFFTQAWPFDHSPDYVNLVHYLTSNNIYNDYQPLTKYWKKECGIPPESSINVQNKYDINNYKIYMQRLDSRFFPDPYFHDEGAELFLKHFRDHHGIHNSINTIKFVFKRFLKKNNALPNFIDFNYGAIFGVSKKNILKNSLDLYMHLYKVNHNHPTHGYIIERLWKTIFT